MTDYSKEREEVSKLFGNRHTPDSKPMNPSFEKNLPRGKVSPPQILEMIEYGYDPLSMKDILLFELAKDEKTLPKRKFNWPNLTPDQVWEINKLEKQCEGNDLAFGAALQDLLMSFLPENTTRSHNESVNKFVDRIKDEPPIYFKNNADHAQKMKERDEKASKLIKGIDWQETHENIDTTDPWDPIRAFISQDEKYTYHLAFFNGTQDPEATEPGTHMNLPKGQFELVFMIREPGSTKVFIFQKIYTKEKIKEYFDLDL